ncbi:ankyrin repeat domain-containing protein 27-like isoform X2 [Ruditapes philippinarum]|uniref:ankyrin repeat domain-containing protein 27-like isoform X2 n=1 Tax=Ruditapes philippinarum TaxID=129788 RepID=UPI00295AC2FA|nr:ankyrin repeat domain-containing protein 27-like isoform X2 [Ruditapes philippinarum]
MMSQYDEDIYESPFFVALEKQHKSLFDKATANRWVICVPKFSAVKKDELGTKDFEDHILIPAVDNDSAFTTVSKHKVEIQSGQINLASGLKAGKVDILFEETFYNTKDESYRVVCVSGFFNREITQDDSSDSGVDSDWSKIPVTYDECIHILWGHQGSSKTKENFDKMLKIFCGEYQRFEGTADSIPNLADLVASHVTKAMQIVLKDPQIKKLVKQEDMFMASLKVAVETYMMNAVHKHLFTTITACVKSSDALINKMTRNLLDIRLHNLDIRSEFEENLPYAKKEVSRLNQFSTPLGRVLCLKRVVTALTKPLFKSQENEGLMMSSDELLPLLIYLIIKSQMANWTANLMYMKYFQVAKMTESNEFSFYLATIEAALDYISSGNLKQGKETGFSRQTSGSTTTSKDKFFQYVQYGDEAAVSLMLKKHKPTTDDISTKLCHPLCTCDKCIEITSQSSQNSGAVSSIARDDMGRTALHIAAFYGQGALIDILCKHGCLTDATDYLGCTPLHLASQKGYQNIILLLVHFGADISAVDNEGNTSLHLCAKNGHEDCVKAILFLDILKNKLNVNAQNDMGDTPLHMAARWGYDGIVNFLLESEADPRVRNRKRQTPYNVAQNADIKKKLLAVLNDPPPLIIRQPVKPATLPVQNHVTKTAPTSAHIPTPSSTPQTDLGSSTRQTQDKTPLGFEVIDVKVRPPIQLVDNSSSEMMSPTTPAVASLDQTDLKQIEKLYKAIASRDLPLVEYYFGWVDSSSSSDSPVSPPTTPVLTENIAAKLCHPLCQCDKCKHIQKHSSVNTLHVNCQNKKGFAPLHIAVIEDYMEVLRLLLKKGAFVNVQTHKHITPLHLACYHNQTEMVELLVKSGADVNIRDQHGEIALHLAAAKCNLPTVTFLLQRSSTVNLGNVNGNTTLHHAVCTGNLDIIGILLKYGANPDALNKHHKSPADMTKDPVILDMLKKKSEELRNKLTPVTPTIQQTSVPKSESAPEHLRDKQQQQGNEKLRKMVSNVEDKHLNTLQQIGQGIKTFDRQRKLKRSQTFDHSSPAINDASLKLALSIQHFDKEKSLRKAQTLDRTSLSLKSLEHSMSIQHFDFHSLKHVESVDKSSPLHLYSLTRTFSCYSDYSDTPTEEQHKDIQGGNSDFTERTIETGDDSVIKEESVEEVDKNMHKDNSDLIDQIVEETDPDCDRLNSDNGITTGGNERKNTIQSDSENVDLNRQVSESSAIKSLVEIPSSQTEGDVKPLTEGKTNEVEAEGYACEGDELSTEICDELSTENHDEVSTEIQGTKQAEVNDVNVIDTIQCDVTPTVNIPHDENYVDREVLEPVDDEKHKTNEMNREDACDKDNISDSCKDETAGTKF